MAKSVFTKDTDPLMTFIRLCKTREDWTISSGVLDGRKVTPRDRAAILSDTNVRQYLTDESYLAFTIDEPDYVITYNKVPIGWHATTRGSPQRADASAHEWVTPTLLDHALRMAWWRKQTRRAQAICTRLNELIVIERNRK